MENESKIITLQENDCALIFRPTSIDNFGMDVIIPTNSNHNSSAVMSILAVLIKNGDSGLRSLLRKRGEAMAKRAKKNMQKQGVV